MNNKQFQKMMSVVNDIDKRVSALEKVSMAKPSTSEQKMPYTKADGTIIMATPKQIAQWTKGNDKVSKAKPEGKSLLEKFEPKKGEDGNYIWASYKKCRSAYCYECQGVATYKGRVKDYKQKADVDYDKQWKKDKAAFEKAYKYVRVNDR